MKLKDELEKLEKMEKLRKDEADVLSEKLKEALQQL